MNTNPLIKDEYNKFFIISRKMWGDYRKVNKDTCSSMDEHKLLLRSIISFSNGTID